MFKLLFRNAIKNFVLNELLPAVVLELNAKLTSDVEKAAAAAALEVLKEKLLAKL